MLKDQSEKYHFNHRRVQHSKNKVQGGQRDECKMALDSSFVLTGTNGEAIDIVLYIGK